MSNGGPYQEVMPLEKLTDKQERFVQEYMVDFNRVRAFFAAGFSAPSNDIAASRVVKMMHNPLIQAAIRQKQQEYALQCRRYLPLDVMLANLDYWFTKAQKRSEPTLDEEGNPLEDDTKDVEVARKMAQEVARDAAPYIHPRLQAIAVTTVGKKAIHEYSDDELIAIAGLTQQPADGGGSSGASGNTEEGEGA